MKEYHIVFKHKEDDFFSHGKDFTEENELKALGAFYLWYEKEFPESSEPIFQVMHLKNLKQ